MKLRTKLLSATMAVAMCVPLVALTSCGGEERPEPRQIAFEITPERKAQMDAESDTIRVIFPGLDSAADEWRNKAVVRFEEQTGKKVEYIPTTFDTTEVTEKIYASIASQNPYDGVWATSTDYPLYYVRQYAEPIDGYVDLEMLESNGYLNRGIMDDFYKYNGQYYLVVPKNFVNPMMCFYNKDMLEELGLEDPKELLEKNEWTVENFHEMASKATRDVDGDGVYDSYGIATVYENLWQDMNHTSMVTTDASGKYVLNLDSPALLRSFDYVRDIRYNRNGVWDNAGASSGMAAFAKGTHLFLLDAYWAIWQLYQSTDPNPNFNWDVLPLPYGADNTEHYNSISSGGMGFINGCPNPYTTATLIEYLCQEDKYEHDELKATYGQYYTEERQQLSTDMQEKAFYSTSYDALITKLGRDLLQDIGYGKDNASSIERWRATYESDLSRINATVEWPEITSHDPYTFDFESNVDGWEVGPTVKEATVTQATGADAIDGSGSMKLEFNPDANGSTVVLATLAEQYRLYGYSTYKVSFDYKVVGDMTEETQYFLAYYNLSTKKQKDAVYFNLEASTDGSVKHAEITLEPEADNETVFTMLIGARKAPGTLIIDNVKIEQVRAN